MDEPEFITLATHDPDLASFLRAVAEEVRPELGVDRPQQYAVVGGVDVVVFFAASALYRYVNVMLEHRRQQMQTEILKEQAAVVASLVGDGLSPKEAQALVTALVKHNAQQVPEDSAVSRALQLLK